MTAYEGHYGCSSTDLRGVASALVPELNSMISQGVGTGIAPWLRYHLNRDLKVLIACRRYYPDRLVDRFPPRSSGDEQRDPVLLRGLADIASAVDALGAQEIDPNNLLMDGEHAFLSDFGPALKRLGDEIRYASPPFLMRIPNPVLRSGWGPQPNLAVFYYYLRTGVDEKNLREDAATGELCLDALPDPLERAAVAKAMERNPAERFGSCAEFIAHLSAIGR
jgi:hypothetical protein